MSLSNQCTNKHLNAKLLSNVQSAKSHEVHKKITVFVQVYNRVRGLYFKKKNKSFIWS